MPRKIYRGDLFFADLNPVSGSEQGGFRPVLIIQNNKGNRYSSTVIVAAVSGRLGKKKLPTHFKVKSEGLKKESLVLLEQIRTLDKNRLKYFIGRVSKRDMKKVDRCLAVSLSLKLK